MERKYSFFYHLILDGMIILNGPGIELKSTNLQHTIIIKSIKVDPSQWSILRVKENKLQWDREENKSFKLGIFYHHKIITK